MNASQRLAPAALLLFAPSIFAQSNISRIILEVSTDRRNWFSRVDALPGAEITVRVRMQLLNPEPGILGLGGATYQPALSNWDAGRDERRPFTDPDPGSFFYGRVFPFASVGQGSSSASGLLTSFNDPGGVLRFAGANCVTMTTNLSWGVNSAQLTQQLGGTNFVGGTDVVVFRYGVALGDTGAERTLVASVPLAGVQNTRMTWFRTAIGTNSLLAPLTIDNIIPAEIHVIPSPAAFVPLVLALLAPRRKRS